MTEQEIFEQLVKHHENTGEIMKPTTFSRLFHEAEPQAMVQAIYRLNAYLDTHREEKTC